jgi:hypothetical protein
MTLATSIAGSIAIGSSYSAVTLAGIPYWMDASFCLPTQTQGY